MVAVGWMLLPLACLVAVALVALYSVLGSHQHSINQLEHQTVPLLRLQASVTANAGVDVLLGATPDAALGYAQQVQSIQQGFAENGHYADAQIVAAVTAAHAQFTKATTLITGWRDLPASQRAGTAITTRAAFAAEIRQSREALTPAITRSEALASAGFDRSRADVLEATALIATVALAALIVAILVAIGVARSVLSPLARMQGSLAQLGSGDLGHRLRLNRKDEFAQLATALNAMANQLEQQHRALLHRAHHDHLTGLGNRAMLRQRLAAIAARPATPGSVAAVLLIDLDDFKTINDGLGHAVGDELLLAVAGRLAASTRHTDTAIRLGGDEFAVLLDGVSGIAEAQDAATRLLNLLEQPFVLSGRQVRITASIGVAVTEGSDDVAGAAGLVVTGSTVEQAASARRTTHGAEDSPVSTFGGEQLVQGADLAMYAAKRGGKNNVRAFEATMLTALFERIELEAELRTGIAAGQLRVYYQPIIDLATGRAYGAEALVRWRHPTRGLIPPDVFIPLAEQTGLVMALTPAVLGAALAQVAQWRHDGLWPTAGRIAVNISPRHLQHPGLPELISRCLDDAGVPGDALTAEITETALLTADSAHAAVMLNELRQAGIRVAIDDFGVGYSNLTRLEQYPIDTLKIDRSFLSPLLDGHDAPLAATVIALGNALGLRTIAEGVETRAQATWLRVQGCTHAQGYLYDRALTAARFTERLARQAKGDRWPNHADCAMSGPPAVPRIAQSPGCSGDTRARPPWAE